MATELRKTGISVVGDMPWGTHFCCFYEMKQDLLDILIPYFKVGLDNNEFCLWIISNSELQTMQEAMSALRKTLPDLDRYLAEGSIEVVAHNEWFLDGGAFDIDRVANGFKKKLDEALARGYAGIRVSGSPAWLQKKDGKELREFEEKLDKLFLNERIIASCSYPLGESGADFLMDVAHNHQFAIARRHGNWNVLETPELSQAKREIKRLNEELEQRVVERTGELEAANEELRREIGERKQAEEALKESQRRLEEAQRIAHVGHYEHDLDTGVIIVSDENHRILGLQPQESITLSRAFEFIHPEDRARVHQVRNEAVRAGQRFNVEYRVVRPDGEVRYIHSEGDVFRDEQGRARRTFGIAQDITERKRAEEALRQSEDRIRLIINTIPVMAWSVRPDGIVDFLNQRWMEYAGLSFEQYVADPTGPIHPQDIPGVIEKWQTQMALGKAYDDEMRLRGADGEYRWFLVRTAPLRDEHGNIVKWYGVSTDIEDRKRAEQTLKQSESQMAEAESLAHVGGWTWDLRSNAITWSEELYRIFGLQPGAVKAAGDAQPFVHPEDRDLIWSTVKRSVSNKEPYSFYYRILRPDGSERIVHTHGSIICDEQGEPIRAFGFTQDVTERRRAEEKLRTTTEQLRALSARLQSAREEEGTRIAREIHDELGAALSSLRWDLESLDKTISDLGSGSQHRAMREKINLMMRLTDTTVSAVRRITQELRPSLLDDLGLIEALEWQAEQFQTRTGIICLCDCSLDNLELNEMQTTAIFRIFQEALTNILRHAQATKVDITTAQEDGEFVLTISDNGRGITTSEKSGAQSLGLLGMQERAHLIRAHLDITGVEGKGTVVTLRVPING